MISVFTYWESYHHSKSLPQNPNDTTTKFHWKVSYFFETLVLATSFIPSKMLLHANIMVLVLKNTKSGGIQNFPIDEDTQ